MEKDPSDHCEDLNLYIDTPQCLGPLPQQYAYPHVQAQKLLGKPFCPEIVANAIALIELALHLGACKMYANEIDQKHSQSQSG